MKMKGSSSTALLVFAAVLAVVGGMIASPDGRLLTLIVAGLMTLLVLFFGASLIRRVIALAILVGVVLQAVPAWREFGSRPDSYRTHARESQKTGDGR